MLMPEKGFTMAAVGGARHMSFWLDVFGKKWL
jgi:hypothetical protein